MTIAVESVLTLRTVSPHFQRSINLTYDRGNADYVRGYIPTERGAQALATILYNTTAADRIQDRAHILHAPYGSGKSLLSLVLSAIISGDEDCATAVDVVVDRLQRHYPHSAEAVRTYQNAHRRLLPVILSGDESTFAVALTRALTRTLSSLGLSDFHPRTQFVAALHTIEMWERLYPDVHRRLQEYLVERGQKLSTFVDALHVARIDALALFEGIYPQLTAGARFDGYANVTLTDAFHDTATTLRDVGYDGICIIWDEFGRFMEAKADEAFGAEAAQLQQFAEFCNRSGQAQVHLVLVAHRQLLTYAAHLPAAYQIEWARIAERFQSHDITSDPAVMYRLIGEALQTNDVERWRRFIDQNEAEFRLLATRAWDYDLFAGVQEMALRQQIVELTWPLHPLTVYALPRVATRVAQNERTLFTFLASQDAHTLQEILQQNQSLTRWWTVDVDTLWTYFAPGIRANLDTHAIWSGVTHAASKIESGDNLAPRLIKALGILTLVGDVDAETNFARGAIIPSSEILAWAVGAEIEAVHSCLETLARRRVIYYRSADGFWMFVRGSDVDLEQVIADRISRNTPNRLQLRQFLQTDAPAPFHLPRGYNLERCMTRYFSSFYRWQDELTSTLGSDESLKQLDKQGYADGVVVYVLATNEVERKQAIATITKLPPGRAVYVVAERPLRLDEPLQELFALRELQNDRQFIERDERLPRELAFFIEDTQRRLQRVLRLLLQPEQGATWYSHEVSGWQGERLINSKQISQLLSRLCNQWFDLTPSLNNESLNLHKPSAQQISAAEKVIDALWKPHDNEQFSPDLGITGYGPDRLILRTLLVQTGLLTPGTSTREEENSSQGWQLGRPRDPSLAAVWDKVHEFLGHALENEQEIAPLIDQLQLPPFGLRRGVLPLLLAAMLRPRAPVLTIRHQRRPVSPVTGATFTTLCQTPEEFTVELGAWDERRNRLWRMLEDHIYSFLGEHERVHQPLSYLSLGLLRWLQAQPRYCRDTEALSPEARQLRELIRKAQREPARVLLHDLLELLDDGEIDPTQAPNQGESYQARLQSKLSRLMSEIASAYQALLYELDRFVCEQFDSGAPVRHHTGRAALLAWLQRLAAQAGEPLETYRFGDQVVERFVAALRADVDEARFWEHLALAILGVSPHDWNDRSVESFQRNLLEVQTRLQRELFALHTDEAVVELQVNRPGAGERTYRFRPSQLSQQGQHILENFKTTLAVAGRPLSPDERRQVALAFLHYVLEGEEPAHVRKNRSLRAR